MSFSSSRADLSLDAPPLSSNSSPPLFSCYEHRTSLLILTAFSFTTALLLLPFCALISVVGYQRWRRQRPPAASSHSDLFTLHLLAMEVLAVCASFLLCAGAHTGSSEVTRRGLDLFSSTWCVKVQFHTLTCVERYLAVVHPVAYRGLRSVGGVRLRNASIGAVWLLCAVWAGTLALTQLEFNVLYFCSVGFTSAVVCFCSVSVLRALRRPGPGVGGQGGERVDRMKRRAFNTIVSITAVLFLCLGGMLVCSALKESQLLSRGAGCAVLASAVWFSLPSSLVLPLLFLHRAGRLPGGTA